MNSHSEKWQLAATPEEAAKAIKEALENITPQEVIFRSMLL